MGRGELWIFFTPVAEPVNTRIGISPFFDAILSGREDGDERFEGGALVAFQVGKPVYRY